MGGRGVGRIAEAVKRAGSKVWPSDVHEPLTPHEARHCAASYLIADGRREPAKITASCG